MKVVAILPPTETAKRNGFECIRKHINHHLKTIKTYYSMLEVLTDNDLHEIGHKCYGKFKGNRTEQTEEDKAKWERALVRIKKQKIETK